MNSSPIPTTPRLVLLLMVLLSAEPSIAADWPQWGGPNRNFQVEGPNLDPWTEAGPKVLWGAPLGLGYSAPVVVGDTLFVFYREDDEEIVAAFDAGTGERRYERRYPAAHPDFMILKRGKGPHATPLVTDGRLFTVGVTGLLTAWHAGTGELGWQRNLWGEEFAGTPLQRGYAASPLAWEDLVLAPVGGARHGMVAFAQEDGAVRWTSRPFDNSPSSPILVQVGGEPQVVVFVEDEVVGLDPRDGTERWRHEHIGGAAYNVSTPVWSHERRQLFVSSSYGGGSRLLRLVAEGEKTRPVELWHSSGLRVHWTNALRMGDAVYASHGTYGTVFALGLDLQNGRPLWRDRSIQRANYVAVGDRVLALEVEGRLLLLDLSPQGLTVLAEHEVFSEASWTVPTLVGNRLYLRSEERLLALELPLRKVVSEALPKPGD